MLVKDYKLDPHKLTPDMLLEDLGIDSTGMAKLIFNIEDEFSLDVPDEALQLLTLGDVVRFIVGGLWCRTPSTSRHCSSVFLGTSMGGPMTIDNSYQPLYGE